MDAVTATSRVIDAHVHIFPPEIIERREAYLDRDDWFRLLYRDPAARMVTAEAVLEEMDACGVAMAVVFGFAFRDLGLCRAVNDYVIDSVKAYPERLVGLACVAPETIGAAGEAERCLDAGLKGCGELVPRAHTLDGGWEELGRRLAERGAPVLLHANEPVGHMYPGKGSFPLRMYTDFVSAHPDLTIVLAHLGGGLLFYELMPELRRMLQNVYYDTAAVPYLYEAGVYVASLTCVSREKLLFGSDFPLLSASRYLPVLADLAAEVQAAVLGGNAKRVYGL